MSAAADSSSRSNTPKFGWDKNFDLWKLNPLADWSERDVWNYIREHHLPYNPLHDQGYPSIGCTHCTQPVGPGGSPRDGRWAGVAQDRVRDQLTATARLVARGHDHLRTAALVPSRTDW